MVNYQNGKIYKIVCNKTGKIYVGSTTLLLCQRMVIHKKAYNKYLKTNKKYVSVFEIMQNGDYSIVLLENCPCENREQLLKKEREYFDKLECVNMCRPFITNEEKIEMDKQCKKEYRENNRDKIKMYREENKEKVQEYREKNKIHIKQKTKEYREKNIDKIREREKKRYEIIVTCICGFTGCKKNLSRHEKTKKHMAYVNSQNNI